MGGRNWGRKRKRVELIGFVIVSVFAHLNITY